MMSQSPSLTAALEAVDRVFCAETGDLKELAKIAGILPDVLFLRADLSGLDIRSQSIDFLLPLETNYHAAILTTRQRRAFQKENRQGRLTNKIRDLRVTLVTRFIRDYAENSSKMITKDGNRPITATELENVLLKPLLDQTRSVHSLTADYMNNVINNLGPLLSRGNTLDFFTGIFKLLGDIQCPVDDRTANIIDRNLTVRFGSDLGTIIGSFRATEMLDLFWIKADNADPDYMLHKALEIAKVRKVHANAIERSMGFRSRWGWQEKLRLLQVPFECDSDQAERLATYLTRSHWPIEKTQEILNAKMQTKVQGAIFRQLLAQGKKARVVEVIKWLDDNRGAVGALSLENAFVHIKSFEIAIWLAQYLAPRLGANQLDVIDSALTNLAFRERKKDMDQLAAFRRKHIRLKPKA